MLPLPAVTPENAFFWTSGAKGQLQLQHCEACEAFVHPPQPMCVHCSGELVPRAVSGRGTVVGVTVNHQPWGPEPEVPYAIALIAIDEDPLVRLTTRIVGADPETIGIGQPVEVRFEQREDVWLPLFTPVKGLPPVEREWPELPCAPPPLRVAREKFEDRVALSGVGMSEVGRRLGRDPRALAVDACRRAIADAGLALEDIDGLATYPGGGAPAGFSEGGVPAMAEALGIRPTWFAGGMETPGQGGSIVNGMLAVAAGLCRHVLCFRTVWETTAALRSRQGAAGSKGPGRVSGEMEWRLPFGAPSAANWIALQASHHMHRFGTTREQLAWIPLTAREHASRNPHAIYRDPITLADYLDARMISTPFGLYDCDVPCDGAVAIVVSRAEVAGDLAQPPVLVEAVGTHLGERLSWDQGSLVHEPLVDGPAAHLWTRTDMKPKDVDVACLYDGFSFNCLSWIEALGFCERGEGGAYIEGGTRIRAGGDFVLNPHGGQLSAGRLHGYGFFHEAVVQLRRAAGERQVEGAEVALVSTGGGHPGGCVLLRRA